MSYLVSEIMLSLIAAAGLGVALGWCLCAASRRRGNQEDLRKATTDVARLEARLRELGPESMVLGPRVAELEAQARQLESALATARQQVAEGRTRVDELIAENAKLEFAAASATEQAERADDRLEALQRDRDDGGDDDGLSAARSRVGDLQDELFANQARLSAMREQIDKLRGDALQAGDDLAVEREAHAATAARLEALESVHADCDFAFSALRDQILQLRRRVAELEASAAERDSAEDEPQLGNGTLGR